MRTRDEHVINLRYVDGLTLEACGRRHGLTRERVRQICLAAPSWLVSLAAQREAARNRLRRYVNSDLCRVCGALFTSQYGSHFCSDEHFNLWVSISRIRDPGLSERHRDSVARWTVAHPDRRSAHELRHAQRVLAGEADRIGRWFIPGSQVHRHLRECWDNDWPIVRLFHPDIIAQLEAEDWMNRLRR